MSTMGKALQVGTLLAVSAGILACAPQKNANVLPSNSVKKTLVVEATLPAEAAILSTSNSVQPLQPAKTLLAQSSKPIEASHDQSVAKTVAVVRPAVKTLTVNQPTTVTQEGQTPQLLQNTAYIFYGTPDQPGYQIQTAIFALFDQGIPMEQAAQQVIELVINQNQIIRDALAMAAVAEQPSLSVEFVLDIAQLTALIDATKRVMEDNPGQLSSIISLGVTLYPDYTKDIIAAAALTGEMTEEDAILVAIGAGADPTLLASSTAAGSDGPGLSAFAAVPLGSGIGAGGTGGGDTTASSN